MSFLFNAFYVQSIKMIRIIKLYVVDHQHPVLTEKLSLFPADAQEPGSQLLTGGDISEAIWIYSTYIFYLHI